MALSANRGTQKADQGVQSVTIFPCPQGRPELSAEMAFREVNV